MTYAPDPSGNAPHPPPPGWYPDPTGIAQYRLWDGATWSPWVSYPSQDGNAPRRSLRLGAAWIALATIAVAVGGNLAVESAPRSMATGLAGIGLLAWNAIGFPGVAWLASYKFGTRSFVRDMGLKITAWDPLIAVGTAVAMYVAMIAISIVTHSVGVPQSSNLSHYQNGFSIATLIFLLVLAGVIAPICEELLFRGALLGGLLSRLHPAQAVAIQAVVFGIAHVGISGGWGNLGLTAALAGVGAVLGTVAVKTGRLAPGMLAHSLFNVAQILLLWATTR